MTDQRHRKDLAFSEKLNEIMNAQKIYPTELSKMSGVDRKLIYSYLNGVNAPSTNSLRKLAKALKVTSDYLLGLSEQSN